MTPFPQRRDAVLAAMAGRPLVMGILNVTPDSFSDGGRFEGFDEALAQAARMEAEGADILDIGGESTRPGSDAVSADEEMARVMPVVEAVAARSNVAVSIDTYKASVARAAVAAGAVIVNDVWGCQRDAGMADAMAETGAIVVLMYNRLDVDPDRDVMADMRMFLDRSMDLATRAGVLPERILVDPGIGFGKTPAQSLTCLNRLDELGAWYGRPVLLGLSRKKFIGHVLAAEVDARLTGTLVANTLGLAKGARVIRVHDVAPHVEAVRMVQATFQEGRA
ncbi:dihydropteroate synthase [Silicimonas algicola]|uniref:Dihydropteroate synthase n=1 Tax=Silicimonas algicola TaxID=1826607 RepID=A0A316G895_9RHOB|nr:dihydropteroate synthase [Silicimonas algicola]AZQ69352.1 dihydropteroate synthase [Silicimonas algicola]PWK56415.1 dihydropteroate synthase [Silicimonas algicola]